MRPTLAADIFEASRPVQHDGDIVYADDAYNFPELVRDARAPVRAEPLVPRK